ncbi:MAG: proton-conducting transporter membrane subunit [Patescibacteria group bacterium]
MELTFLVFIPLLIGLVGVLVRKNIRMFDALYCIGACAEIITAVGVFVQLHTAQELSFAPFFFLDALSGIVLLTVIIVSVFSSIYSIGYLREEVKKGIIGFRRVKQYFLLYQLFVAAMFAGVLSASPILMWIAIETTTLSTTLLISFYNKASATEAAWKYLLINSIGLLLAFFGTLLFFAGESSVDMLGFPGWHSLSEHVSEFNPDLLKIAFIFILVGYGTKVGFAPMHTWLPDAHSKAPPPISALLSGALLNVALLAIFRFKIITDSVVEQSFSNTMLIGFGLVSVVIAAFIILAQKKYKRLFAYSSIEHMGIIALGCGFGGLGIWAALLHMIYHSIAKSLLFFISGSLFLKYGLSRISNIKGMITILPVSTVLLFCGLLAITGVPPFGMFITEIHILVAGIAHYGFASVILLVSLVLVFVGFLRHIVSMAFSEAPPTVLRGESNVYVLTPSILLSLILIILSVYLPPGLSELLTKAAELL